MQEPIRIGKASALALHDRQLAEHGGLAGMRDEGLLESALARPQNQFFYGADRAALAAAYAYGIAINHPLLDGNKRTALMVSFVFVERNGGRMTASEADAYDVFVRLAAGAVSETELAAWFRANGA